MSQTIRIAELDFTLRVSARRKTLGITVERDGSLVISSPPGIEHPRIESLVRGKLPWLHDKLAARDLLLPSPPEKEYVSGESHYYLGRSYRLLLVEETPYEPGREDLRLANGRFVMQRADRDKARRLFTRWYAARAAEWIGPRLDELAPRVGAIPRGKRIIDLGNRWGSCSRSGWLYFHWRTICMPPSLVEYVVAHELVHLVERRHSRTFWDRLERLLPDFQERRRELARVGGRY
jgi:predicted metal-dependent hydrolase